MITRGYAVLSHPLESVHEAVLETFEEMNAQVRDIKSNSDIDYQFEVQTASILDKAFRVNSGRFQIRLQNRLTKPEPSTLIDIYDYYFHAETETKFIFPFFKCLARHLRLDSGFRIYPVEAPTNSLLPTYALAEHNRKLVVLPTLLEGFHYRISIIDDGGILAIKNANTLRVNLVESGSTVSLMRGNKVLLTIPIREILEVAATSYLRGNIRKGNDYVLEVIFNDREHNKRSLVINVDDKYVNRIQQQISAIRDSQLGKHEITWGYLDKLCTICTKNKPIFRFSRDNICSHCFAEKYGQLALPEETGEYHGGHKVHLAGGTFGDYESGKMYLTDEYLIFAKGNKNPAERWEIEIPINSIVTEQWGVRAESRRKNIVGGSTAVTSNVSFGGGIIQEAGKKHRLLVPYIDENGILQEPVFGISSFKGKTIRKWAAELYNLMVKRKQTMDENLVIHGSHQDESLCQTDRHSKGQACERGNNQGRVRRAEKSG
jgi:hypothetical protein